MVTTQNVGSWSVYMFKSSTLRLYNWFTLIYIIWQSFICSADVHTSNTLPLPLSLPISNVSTSCLEHGSE